MMTQTLATRYTDSFYLMCVNLARAAHNGYRVVFISSSDEQTDAILSYMKLTHPEVSFSIEHYDKEESTYVNIFDDPTEETF